VSYVRLCDYCGQKILGEREHPIKIQVDTGVAARPEKLADLCSWDCVIGYAHNKGGKDPMMVRLKNEVDKLKKDKPCTATISHGPGHQSRTKCERTGPHDLHYAHVMRTETQWRGEHVFSGASDEFPWEE